MWRRIVFENLTRGLALPVQSPLEIPVAANVQDVSVARKLIVEHQSVWVTDAGHGGEKDAWRGSSVRDVKESLGQGHTLCRLRSQRPGECQGELRAPGVVGVTSSNGPWHERNEGRLVLAVEKGWSCEARRALRRGYAAATRVLRRRVRGAWAIP